jgi:hypothetical protein
MILVTKNQKFTDQMPTDRSQNHLWIIGEAASNSYRLAYLKTKKEKMEHGLSLGQHESIGWADRRHADGKDFDIR